MRREPTPAEHLLWKLLSRYRPAFTRQLSIDDRYIVDLANRTARLAVEVDGGQHFDQAEYDAERTAYLESLGWRVIRLWNNDVLANPAVAANSVPSRVLTVEEAGRKSGSPDWAEPGFCYDPLRKVAD